MTTTAPPAKKYVIDALASSVSCRDLLSMSVISLTDFV